MNINIKTLLTLSALLTTKVYAAELSTEALLSRGESLSDSYQVSIRVGDPIYGWAAYSKHNEVMTTQDIGVAEAFSLGLGYKINNWFLEFGAKYLRHNTVTNIAKEAIWYAFEPTFGKPPFAGHFLDIDYSYNSNYALVTKIGHNLPLTNHLALRLAYSMSRARTTFSMWSPSHNGGPNWNDLAACGCLWIGSQKTNMDNIEIGFTYKY